MDVRLDRIRALEKRLEEAREKARATKKRSRNDSAATPDADKTTKDDDTKADTDAISVLSLGAVRSALGVSSKKKKRTKAVFKNETDERDMEQDVLDVDAAKRSVTLYCKPE